MTEITILLGMPCAGKSTLSQQLAPHLDRLIEFDFIYNLMEKMNAGFFDNIVSACSYLPDPLFPRRGPDCLDDALRKITLSRGILHRLCELLTLNDERALIEGWQLLPDPVLLQQGVKWVYLDPGEQTLKERWAAPPDPLSETVVKKLSAIYAYQKNECRRFNVPVLTGAKIPAFLKDFTS